MQLLLDRPIGAVRGDGVILRDQTAQRTLGGGNVIDIYPPRRGRAKPERRTYLAAMEPADDDAALARLLEGAGAGLDLGQFAANRNLTAAEAEACFARHPMRAVATATTRLGFAPSHWDGLKAAVLEGLAAAHRRAPDAMGPSEDRIFAGTPIRLAREVALAVAHELVRDGTIIRDGTGVRLPSHQPKLVAADAALWRRVEPVLDQTPLRPPSVHEIAAALREDAKKIEALMVRVARLGLLVRLTRHRFIRPQALHDLGAMAAALGTEAADHRVTAASFRDRAGVGRNVAIELLEYFDRVKFTRRIGDAHEIVQTVAQAFGPAS